MCCLTSGGSLGQGGCWEAGGRKLGSLCFQPIPGWTKLCPPPLILILGKEVSWVVGVLRWRVEATGYLSPNTSPIWDPLDLLLLALWSCSLRVPYWL